MPPARGNQFKLVEVPGMGDGHRGRQVTRASTFRLALPSDQQSSRRRLGARPWHFGNRIAGGSDCSASALC